MHRLNSHQACGFQPHQIEEDIQNFVENFKRKSSILDRRLSCESGESSGMASSMYSTDDYGDEVSPTDRIPVQYLPVVKMQKDSSFSSYKESEYSDDLDHVINLHHRRQTSESSGYSNYADSDIQNIFQNGDGMGEPLSDYLNKVNLLDVAHLLQAKYVILTGGKAKNGAPILTFPEHQQKLDVADEEYRKVIAYLSHIPPITESEQGFVLILDRRNSDWNSVKSLLLRISCFFPYHVQVVFLLQPHGFFQRAFSDFKSKFVKEQLEFKVVLCNKAEEFYDYIELDQLTTDLGGLIEFDANEWTENRMAVEKYASNTEQIAVALHNMVTKFKELELPNDVSGTETMIKEHTLERAALLEDLNSAGPNGLSLLACIKGDNPVTPLVSQCHVLIIERLIMQLEETGKKFDSFWAKHELKLNQCSQLRKFEEEFKTFQFALERKVESVEEKNKDPGETLQKVETNFSEFEKFEEEALNDLDLAEKMRATGEQLIANDHYAVDSIRPKCFELQRMCEQYKELLRQRRELLTKTFDLQERIDKAGKWCTEGVDLLASQQIENIQDHAGAEKAFQEVSLFMKTSKNLKLNDPKEFRQLFEPIITAETRGVVQKLLKRIEDVQGMCEKRKQSLQKHLSKAPQPGLPSHLPATTNPMHIIDHELKRKQPNMRGNSAIDLEKSARLHVDSRPGSICSSSTSGIESDKSRNSFSSLSTSSFSSTSLPDCDALHTKRQHVLTELIESEKSYVKELQDIITGYHDEFDNRRMEHLIPEKLFEKRDVLFGNLKQICKFHKDIFLQELQNCCETPTKVGKCFINRKEEFKVYSSYCLNKPKSEALRMQVGENNPFFKECQRKLGHKLPLGAYLLKPVQRITKYQLLLKEMLKYTDNDRVCACQLQEAVDSMLDVLQHVNDSMHQISIVGFSGKYSELGRLLNQGCFDVWTNHKGGKILQNLHFRPSQRQIFLYERAILLCKRQESQYSDSIIYSFRNLLNLTQVGLTENIKGDKRRFELWWRGREQVYTLQASSLEKKDKWVKEIKKVLQNQFSSIKENVLNLKTKSNDEDNHSTVSISIPTDIGVTDNYKSKHLTVNNNPTVPVGIGMMSPLESPTDFPQNFNEEEEDGWSSGEFSSEEENSPEQTSHTLEPPCIQRCTALADYIAIHNVEMNLHEGDTVEILRLGDSGWWYARNLMSNQEGWIPSTYLEVTSLSQSQSQNSVSSLDSSDNWIGGDSRTSTSKSSPVQETTV